MLPDYNPVSIFVGLFSSKWVHFEPAELAGRLKSLLADFDLPPALPNVPQNAPGEMPRVMLLGDGKNRILELAPKKVNLRLICQPGQKSFDELFEQFLGMLSNVVYKVTEYEFSFNRVGIILTLFREFRENGHPVSGNQKLIDYFFQQRDIFKPTPSETQLNVHSQFDLSAEVPVNRWIRFRPLRRNPDNEDCALQVEIDLNTLPQLNRQVSLQDITDFLILAKTHVASEIDFLSNPEF